jgi:hypothetical protein
MADMLMRMVHLFAMIGSKQSSSTVAAVFSKKMMLLLSGGQRSPPFAVCAVCCLGLC